MKSQPIKFQARELRSNLTEAEKLLWSAIRNCQLDGCRFRRQAPIGFYIADFVCFEKGLIIEVDGGQHAQRKEYDKERTRWLNSQGFKVIRFWNNEVMKNMAGVVEEIMKALCTPHPSLPPQGGKGQL